jgi:hypothetical protein
LSDEVPRNSFFPTQIKDGFDGFGHLVTSTILHMLILKFSLMKNEVIGGSTVFTECGGHCHVKLGRVKIRQIKNRECCLVRVNSLRLVESVA